MNPEEIFRPAALRAQGARWLSDPVRIHGPSFKVLATAAAAAIVALASFFYWGTYTPHSTVQGQLVLVHGLSELHAPQAGYVLERRVPEGAVVRRGDVIYVLSVDQRAKDGRETQATISAQIHSRAVLLMQQMEAARSAEGVRARSVSRRTVDMKRELAQISAQLETQQERVESAEQAAEHARELLQQGYFSKEQFRQQQEQLLSTRAALQSLQREQLTLARQMHEQESTSDLDRIQFEQQLAELQRQHASALEELAQSEARRAIFVTAAEAGTAGTLLAEPGQAVEAGRLLASIVPRDETLQAHLLVPSDAVGFVRTGDHVSIRYDAFPYQRFGSFQGHVQSISQNAMSQEALRRDAATALPGAIYLVRVSLDSQSISVGEQHEILRPGMTLSADLLQRQRRLYQWTLEPLRAVKGRL